MLNLPFLLAQENTTTWVIGVVAIIILGFMLLVLFIAAMAYGKLWFQAYMSRADVTMIDLIGMGFRQVKSNVIVTAKIMSVQAGLSIDRRTGISTKRLEAHYLAGW